MITYGPEFEHIVGDTRSTTVTVIDAAGAPIADYFADASKVEFLVFEQMSGDQKAALSTAQAAEIEFTAAKDGFVLHLGAAQISALPQGRYRHIAKVTWSGAGDLPTYLLRNIFVVETP